MLSGREKIQEVLQRTEIVELVRRHVELRKVGRSWVGLCPFHGERTPSFHVFPESRRFKCFGCDKGGDAIAFVMEIEGKDFPTTLRQLAEAAGVPLAYDPEEQRRIAHRRELLRACQVASAYFETSLWSQAGRAGRAHLEQRGVTEQVARAAGLGYAPSGWQGLCDRLAAEGVDSQRAVEAGLILPRDGARHGRDGFYDVFRGRLMVPIRDPEGRVIAFGGRIVEGDDARKYVNSRETPLYRKSRVLYGMDVAKGSLRTSGEAVLVEGYFDAIAMWQAGVRNAVALCSTSLTREHLELLERLGVERLTLLLDGDEAGQRAALRLAGPILASGLAAKVITLPDGNDPDTFLQTQGEEAYRTLEASAPPLSTYVLSRATADGDGYEGAMRALAELRPVVSALGEGVERSLFFGEIARTLDLQVRDVEAFFQGNRAPAQRQAPAPIRGREGRPPPRRELELAACLFAYPALRQGIEEEVLGLLTDMGLREAIALLLADALEEDEILSRLPPQVQRALAERVRQVGSLADRDWAREVSDGLLHLEMDKLREDLRTAIGTRGELEQELFGPGDPAAKEEILEQVRMYGDHATRIRERMKALKQQLQGAAAQTGS